MSYLWSLFSSGSSQQLWDSAKFSIIKDIRITEVEIGRGSYGVIYKAIYGGKECVAKEIHHNLMVDGIGTNTVIQSFIKEVNVLSTLRHPSIVNFIGVHFKEGSHVPILIIEKMWKSLAALLLLSVPHNIKVHILKDVACGLNYLHSQDPPILHRDLTANNILLSSNLDAKIADLGLAKALETITTQRMSTVPGTSAYMPPEALQSKPVYTTKLDVFSFGCLIIHTVTQEFPSPTDQFVASDLDSTVFLKISEYKRRGRYMTMMEGYPHLIYLASACLKDDPEYRPDATRVFAWIDEYYSKPEIKQHCSESLLAYSKLDKFSLIQEVNAKTTKTKELESTMAQYELQVHELTNSTVAKDEEITSLQRSNNELQVSIQSQQSEINQLKSQNDKLQEDMSLQSGSDIVMSLNTMLRQDQEDMKDKQEEIKALKMKLNNLEKSYTSLRKESEEKNQHSLQEDSQLQAHLKKEAEFIQNIEVLSSQKECLVHEKEELNQQVQDYFASLQSNEKEIKELKSKLEQAEQKSMVLDSTSVDKQPVNNKPMGQSTGKDNPSSESIVHHKEKEFQDKIQNMSAHMMKMQKENEELKYKFKKEEEMKQKLQEETEQRVKEKLDYWKARAESVDKDLAKKLEEEKQRLEQEKEKLKEKVLAVNKLSNNHLAEFNKTIEETQVANENYAQKVKQVHQCLASLEKQKKENAELKQKLSNAKAMNRVQLDEKSLRLSLLQPQLNACQQKLDDKDKQLVDMQSQNENLQKLLENVSKLHTALQKELEKYKAVHKEELKISKEISLNADTALQTELQKCQELIREKENEMVLLNESLQQYHETNLQLQRKIKQLEKENRKLTVSQSKSSRQLENKLKEKAKYIESLEKKTFTGYSSYCHYSLHWSPYLSLPVRRIKPSAAVVKDKVFVTGGYQDICPQGRELDSYLKCLEKGNEVFCFHTGKFWCDSIASPAMLGGVASVNGQCVLVSGAEGNTLTGNVYVLCEEESDEQWKNFSKPVPTPRILPCVCCYDERWIIVCGGYACKEGSNLLEAVNMMEIFDLSKGEWYTIPEAGIPTLSTISACSVVGGDVYIIGDDKVLRSSGMKLVSTMTAKSGDIVWTELQVIADDIDENPLPFSVVSVNEKPMIIASISGSEDDVTCVLMKDATDTWRKMSEAIECQHCSAVVVTPTLELLLFGGSGNVQLAGGTDICQNSTIIPSLNIWDNKDEEIGNKSSITRVHQENMPKEIPVVITQPPTVSFIGLIHTKQFDHKGGKFQSSVDKIAVVVPPNAVDDGERVTVHMGATTSGPFDLPEDCKLRSAVVWLGSGSDVVLKRSITVVVPHSAVFTSPEHHSMMRFLTCEDCEGPRYKFQPGKNNFEITPGYGLIRLEKPTMMAIVSQSKLVAAAEENVDHRSIDVPVSYIAKLYWPLKSLPICFRADVYCVQNIPTEVFKVDTYRKTYYQKHGIYPDVVGTKLIVCGSKLKCVLLCDSSNECKCFTGWDVSPLFDISEEEETTGNYKIDASKFSFKFNCSHPGAFLSCCFELQGASVEETQIKQESLPKCLKSRFAKLGTYPPILLQSGVNTTTKDTGSSDDAVGSHDQEKLKEKP